jgi:DNA-directed RNA polymerase specialized sigma24 family protein
MRRDGVFWESHLTVEGRREFVAEIAGKHGTRLRRYLAARLRNAADASDLVQEIFLRLLRVDRHESIRNRKPM